MLPRTPEALNPRGDSGADAPTALAPPTGVWARAARLLGLQPSANPLVDMRLAQTYVLDTRDQPFSAAATAAVFWITFLVLTGDKGTLVWALLVHGMQVSMYFHLHGERPEAYRPETAFATRLRLEWRMLFPGLVWASATWLFFPAGNLTQILLLYLFVAGMTSISTAVLAQWWLAAVLFAVPGYLSLALRMMREPGEVPFIMGVLALLQMAGLLYYMRKQSRLVGRSIESGFEQTRLAEALQRQLERVEQLAAQRARVFAAANHDLRQPMHALAIFVGALDPGQPPLAQNIRFMRESIGALRGSVDSLLDISQLDNGVAPVQLGAVSLGRQFELLRGRFGSVAAAKGLRLYIRATDVHVRADENMLARVLANLVDNAIKYTPRGTVMVCARHVARSNGAAGWRIEVRDSGVGIDAAHRSQVFEEFFQVDNPGRDRGRGLGLGLALVASMAGVMHSRIDLRSQPGRGSVFSLALDAASAPEPSAGEGAPSEPAALQESLPAATPSRAPALRILVLDDEFPAREAMRTLLGGWGHEVALAATPHEALQHEGVFDFMLSDLRLANGLSGLDAAQQLKALGKTREVVILTGETAQHNRVEVESAGFAMLYKPVDPRHLRAQLATAA